MYEDVLYEVRDRAAWITLNHPERLNAISHQMMNEIIEALREAEADQGIHLAVIQGAGRAFSAGYQIGAAPDLGDRPFSTTSDRDLLEDRARAWLTIPDIRIPVIAKVHGYCIAGGTHLAAVCDVTFAAEDTRVGSGPQMPLGAGFITSFWSWFMGPKKAKQLVFPSGEFISGADAARYGLFSEAVPAAELDAFVEDYVHRVSRVPRDVLSIHKLSANRVQEIQGFRAAVRGGVEFDALAHFSPAVQEMRGRVRDMGMKAAIDSWKQELQA